MGALFTKFVHHLPKNGFHSAREKLGGNVGEIDPCSQFHQHFISSFCNDNLAPKNYNAKLYVTREKLHKTLSHKKVESKM